MIRDLEQFNLDQLEALIAEVRTRGQPNLDDDALRTLIRAADTLSSRDLGDYERQTALLYEAADLAIRTAPVLSLEDELHLLAHLETELPNAQRAVADWPPKRRDRAHRWLGALGRLDHAIDPTFDPDDKPALNVLPPEGLPSGVAPERIREPGLRQRYEADIASNHRKAERYAEQWRARQLRELYEPRGIGYLGLAYGASSGEREELDQLLDEHEVSEERKNMIRMAARERGDEQPG